MSSQPGHVGHFSAACQCSGAAAAAATAAGMTRTSAEMRRQALAEKSATQLHGGRRIARRVAHTRRSSYVIAHNVGQRTVVSVRCPDMMLSQPVCVSTSPGCSWGAGGD